VTVEQASVVTKSRMEKEISLLVFIFCSHKI
jgi:hypothetical protein